MGLFDGIFKRHTDRNDDRSFEAPDGVYDEDDYAESDDRYDDVYDDYEDAMNCSDYDDVYDETGDSVLCDYCHGEIKWKDGRYVCPECGQVMTRDVFFNYIGAEPPGPECLTCGQPYPVCYGCPYGYARKDE